MTLPDPWRARAKTDIPLADYTTMRIGGAARWLIELSEPDEVAALARDLTAETLSWRLLGGGSNVLAADEGFTEPVVVFRSPDNAIRIEGATLIAPGGAAFDACARAAVNAGLAGLEFAAGIPGTLGGAIFGNAGAFGRQVGDVIDSLTLMDRDGHIYRARGHELAFAYRHSVLKQNGHVVLEARLTLAPGDRMQLLREVDEIMALRRAKHPDLRQTPCAGSFFRNIEPTSLAARRQAAGAFLDEIGAKSMRVGDAAVFEKHANIIVNAGRARAADIVALAIKMRRAVAERFGIALMREVQIWSDMNLDELP